MKLVDANVLIYAVNASGSTTQHDEARAWLDRALVATEPVGFSWIVMLAFVRLVTKVGLFPNPMPIDEALNRLRAWLEQPAALIVEPTSRHLEVLAGLLRQVGVGGNLVGDAHLAALAAEHDAMIVTFDPDFTRFAGVVSRRPTDT